jgi:hypothetical protein
MEKLHWGILGLGALLVPIAFLGPVETYSFLITACFLGITSRIVQAEFHSRQSKQD